MELPKSIIKATSLNPRTLLLYGLPKMGKTTVLSQLDGCLIIDLEKGSGYVDALKVNANTYAEFVDVCRSIHAAGKPYSYIAIDTMSQLDTWSEVEGTNKYMTGVQGKTFNRDAKGNKILPGDPSYQSVHELGQGFGYRYSREVMVEWYERLCTLAEHVIFICHVKDKFVASKSGDAVVSKDIALTGKVKDILCSKVDAIVYMHRENDKLMVSFGGDGDKVCGSRCGHLKGQTFEFDWKLIYK